MVASYSPNTKTLYSVHHGIHTIRSHYFFNLITLSIQLLVLNILIIIMLCRFYITPKIRLAYSAPIEPAMLHLPASLLLPNKQPILKKKKQNKVIKSERVCSIKLARNYNSTRSCFFYFGNRNSIFKRIK